MNKILSWFCYIFLKPIVDLIFIKKVKGLENRPKTNFILAANHQSHLDQIFTAYVAVPRSFRMIGQVDRYNERILTKFFRDLIYFLAGVIPLDRRSPESKRKVIKKAVDVLKKGDILIIYPEGTRTRLGEGKIQKAKSGVGKLHLLTSLPILPVAVKGSFLLLPPGKVFPKIKKIIKINVGKPMIFEEEIKKAKNLDSNFEEFKKISQRIANEVIEEIKNLYQKI